MKNQLKLLQRGLLAPLMIVCLAATGMALPERAVQEGGDKVMMIKLRGGLFQWGMIEDHTADLLTFRRIDTGGVVIVPWTLLDPTQELELKTKFGYIDLTSEEILITAEKLILRDGREVIGLLLERTDTLLFFQTQGRVLQIPKALVKDHIAGLQVPALDVKSKEELYREKEQLIDPENPEDHYKLAGFCERILDFSRAREHYEAARTLDAEFKSRELDAILARVTIRVENQEQVDFLANVDLLKRKRKFANALDQLALFDSNYPDSPLITERLKMEDRVLRARSDYMHREVSSLWFSWMGRLVTKSAREHGYQASLGYLEDKLSEDIVTNITNTLRKNWPDLDEDQVRQFFIERKLGRWKGASYGLGTWLLGEEAAVKGNKPSKPAGTSGSSRDKAREEQAAKIARFLRNQEMAKRARKSEDDEAAIDTAWNKLSVSARRNWMIAYYAENGGDLVVRPKPELRACSQCAGTGVRDVIVSRGTTSGDRDSGGSGAGIRQTGCQTCHGVGIVRRIRYR